MHVTCAGAGTFGTVRAGIYKPKNGAPEVECAIKVLKPAEEMPNQKVCTYVHTYVHAFRYLHMHVSIVSLVCMSVLSAWSNTR